MYLGSRFFLQMFCCLLEDQRLEVTLWVSVLPGVLDLLVE